MLVVYGGPNETHEIAFSGCKQYKIIEGTGLTAQVQNGALLLNWAVTPDRKVVEVEKNLFVYILSMPWSRCVEMTLLTRLDRPQ